MRRVRTILLLLSFAFLGLTLAGAVLGASQRGGYRSLSNLVATLDLVRKAYVEPRDMNTVMEGAFQGLVDALDAESAFLQTPAEMEAALAPADPTAGWVGLDVSKTHGYAVVVTVAPESPAAQAAIERGDILRGIDNHSTRAMSVVAIRTALRPAVGNELTLKVVSGGDLESRDVELTAVKRPPARLDVTRLDSGAALFRLTRMDAGMSGQMERELAALTADPPDSGLVLDLRSVSEGPLTEGLLAANLFVTEGVLARIHGRSDETAARRALKGLSVERGEYQASDSEQEIDTEPVYELRVMAAEREPAWTGPLVVLIDEGTAGAAELLAAALMDSGRAQVVGRRSFGRASIQDILPTGAGTALRLTIARYVRPDGRALAEQGLEPGIEVEAETDSEQGSSADPVLQRALELLGPDGRAKTAA
jgi:carboxyl-terminal processing protease